MSGKLIAKNKNEGESISVVGDTYRVLIGGDQTDGKYAVIDMHVPSGSGPGPHSHTSIAEMFYIIEGEILFKSEEGTHLAGPGSFVNIPLDGPVHSFKNESDKPAHMLCTVVPAGLEKFFEAIGKPVATGTFLPHANPDEKEIEQLKKLA